MAALADDIQLEYPIESPILTLESPPGMPTPPIQLPDLPDAERTPLVEQLLALIEAMAETIHRQAETIQQLRDEIAVLKGQLAYLRKQVAEHAEIIRWLEEQVRRRAA